MNRMQTLLSVPKPENRAWLISSGVNRRYLTDFSSSAGTIALVGGEAYLLVDSRYVEAAQKNARDCTVLLETGSNAVLKDLLLGHGVKTVSVETKTTSLAEVRCLNAQLAPVEIDQEDDSVSRTLDEMRRIKSPEEIDCLRRAQRISEDALAKAARRIRPGVSELDIMMTIGMERTMAGCEARSMDMIFTSGVDTSLPHGNPKIRNIQDGDFVMVDMGSTIGGYASDMTRTLAVGHVTDRQRDVYNTVLDAQLAALEKIRPGVRCRDVDRAARQVVEKSPFAEYCFGHGLGHSLGLEIHEEPRFNPTDETLLRPGMVITVEPGIYIPGAFGVRIEDMVLIAEDGYENLTHFPKQLTIL